MTHRFTAVQLAWPLAVLLTSAPALAKAAPPESMKANPSALARPAGGGMVVGIDPETGTIGMLTSHQRARLTALSLGRVLRLAARPAPVYHADGSVSLDVRSWMREHGWVRLGADGRLINGCLDSREQALHAMKHAPATPAGSEER